MRISDWSSDVCSSDLPNNRCRRCFQRAALLIFADIEAFRIDELDVAQADEVEEGRHERCLRVRRRVLVETSARCKHSHGSASRRGRVGKYVEISLVAVSLK